MIRNSIIKIIITILIFLLLCSRLYLFNDYFVELGNIGYGFSVYYLSYAIKIIGSPDVIDISNGTILLSILFVVVLLIIQKNNKRLIIISFLIYIIIAVFLNIQIGEVISQYIKNADEYFKLYHNGFFLSVSLDESSSSISIYLYLLHYLNIFIFVLINTVKAKDFRIKDIKQWITRDKEK